MTRGGVRGSAQMGGVPIPPCVRRSWQAAAPFEIVDRHRQGGFVLRSLLCAAFLLGPLATGAEATGEIDWQRRVIKARGQGAPDLNAPSISVARLGAERAAKADALRNLLETLKGSQVTSGGSAGGLLQGEDALRMRTEGTLRGFRVVQPHYFSDGGVALDVEVEIDKLPPELGKLLQPPAAAAAPGTAPSGAAAPGPAAPGSGARQHPGGFIVEDRKSVV